MKNNSQQLQTPFRNHAHSVWFRLCAVCLSMYTGYVIFLAHSRLFLGRMATVFSLAAYAAICMGIYGLLDVMCRRLRNAAPRARAARARTDWRFFALAFVIALGIFGCTFASCYPGGVNYDASNQWRQALSGEYNNWHPLFHTLLIRLVMQVKCSYPFVLLVQIVAFSACMAYLAATLHRYGVHALAVLAVHTLVAASLPVRNTLMYLGKDSAMTIGVLLLSSMAVHILFTGGKWLKKPLHAVFAGVSLAYTTLMRVNALFFTLPLLACVFFAFKACRRQTVAAALLMALLIALVQGPLFGALDVVYPANTLEESIGLPMTVLCDVRKADPQKLDRETRMFMNSLATSQTWRQTYRLHNYNSIKFTFPRELIGEQSAGSILKMAYRAARNAPRTAFETFNGVTDLVWDVTGRGEGYQTVSNSGDLLDLQYTSPRLNRLGEAVCRIWKVPLKWQPFKWLTENIGVQLILLLTATLWALYRRGPDVLVLAIPTLLYDLGTMLLLASNDARFFQFSMTIALPMMLTLLYLPRAKENETWN